jgi:hypothetical protein
MRRKATALVVPSSTAPAKGQARTAPTGNGRTVYLVAKSVRQCALFEGHENAAARMMQRGRANFYACRGFLLLELLNESSCSLHGFGERGRVFGGLCRDE